MANVCILVDKYSRPCLSSSFSNRAFTDITIINELLDFLKVNDYNSNTVVIFKDSIKYLELTPTIRLVSKLYRTKIVIATDEIEIDKCIDYGDNSYLVETNLKDLDYSDIMNIANINHKTESRKELAHDVNVIIARALLEDQSLETIHDILKEYLNYKDQILITNKEIMELRGRVDLLQSSNERLSDKNKEIQKLLNMMIKKSVKVNNTLMEYEVILSNDMFPKVDIREFPDAPNIIYLKHQHPLDNLNELIESLMTCLREQEKVSSKVLRLYDSKGCRDIIAQPDYYRVIGANYTGKEVLTNDYLIKYGQYINILKLLFSNKSSLSYLIIVDCRTPSDTVISGSYPLFNLCGDKALFSKYGLFPENTIFNSDVNEDKVLAWDRYPQLNSLKSDNEKKTFLTSRKCISSIVSIVKTFNRKVGQYGNE